MAQMDVFESDAFSALEMTAAINKQDYQPSMLGDMNLFEVKRIRTEKFEIEERDGKLALVQSSPRGAPLEQAQHERRKVRDFRTVRVAKGDTIMADEIQGIRAFGTESELMQVQAEVARRQMALRRDIELTWEHMRLGAVQGIVTDADGSVLYNFFDEFGVSQPAEINFALGTGTTDIQAKCAEVVRAMQKGAKGAWTPQTQIVGLAGDSFFDNLVTHKETKEAFKYQQSAQLRQNIAYQTFDFGGIHFVNYRGTDDGSTVAIGEDDCKFFPRNAPGAFEVAFSPAESFDFVNTPGQDFYAWVVQDEKRNMWVQPEVYSYPMFYPTRPLMLQRARRA
ncbi:major capsid protein [Arhodomonas sp. AD133]|uniref:major capsid protein n=1 Tax=Arhodomonas sp. AD133 TaxID=3415009 RepID=UPI003EBE27D8